MQAHTNGVSQLSALAYMREAKDLLPFFAPSFPLSSSTCGNKGKTRGENAVVKGPHKVARVYFLIDWQMKAKWLKGEGGWWGRGADPPLNEITVSVFIYNS